MRRLVAASVVVCALAFVAAIAVVCIAAVLGVRDAGIGDGIALTIGDRTLDATRTGIAIGIVAIVVVALAIVATVVAVAAIAASLVVFVPGLLLVVIGSVAIALVVGLSPLLVPVLLVVGACALLGRRSDARLRATLPTTP